MSVRPAAAPALPSPAEMERMVAQAGLTLNAGQMADLALAWRQIVGLVARIPRGRPLLDDQAYVFRVAPPATASAEKAGPSRKAGAKPKATHQPPAGGAAAKTPAKPATKAAAPASAKPARKASRRA